MLSPPLAPGQDERGIVPDVVSVNTAIKACRDEDRTDIALQLFEGMPARGLVPDSVTFTEVIAALGKAGEFDRAISVFELAVESDAVNTFVVNAAIGACAACGRTDEALGLIKRMRLDGDLRPDVVTFTTIMTMCSRKDEYEAVLFLAAEMDAAGLSLTRALVGQVQRARAKLEAARRPRREASV